jgi:hypothetical protein
LVEEVPAFFAAYLVAAKMPFVSREQTGDP